MKKMVYANEVLVDSIEVPADYTVEDYKADCERNGWEFAPCSADDDIELIDVEEEEA